MEGIIKVPPCMQAQAEAQCIESSLWVQKEGKELLHESDITFLR
jgi:hypothetical protein